MAARTAEEVREIVEQGSLNLRGVAAALRHLADVHEDGADLLCLLARDVDLEADAMGEAEVFLGQAAKKSAAPPAPPRRPSRLRVIEKDGA